jgi:Fuc2NAc and GlcNAc transferase
MLLSLNLAILLAAAVAAYAATALIRRNAERLGVVQSPNARSSHTIPTPSGGGVGIVLGGSIATAMAAYADWWPNALLLVTALLVAVIGFYDDRHPLPARIRLTAQIILVAIAIGFGVPLDSLQQQVGLPMPALGVAALGLVAIVYWVNLFNFMDGIDGIAASEAIFICGAGALLGAAHAPAFASETSFWMLLGIAAATTGFLLQNWPPAKIFMGDAGSTYLGFAIAVLALITIAGGWLTLPQWVILVAAFVADATVTLVRRLLLGERVFEAHRRHAYQVLSRRWSSHRKVTLSFIGINVIWLLPLAWAAQGWGWLAVLVAYVPLVGLALYFGAGAPEQPSLSRA